MSTISKRLSIVLLLTISSLVSESCHHELVENDNIGNSYPWGPIYIHNLLLIPSAWEVNLVDEPSGWEDLLISLKWNPDGEDETVRYYLDTFPKEIESALNSPLYRNHWRAIGKQMDRARLDHLERYPYIIDWLDASIEEGICIMADKPILGRNPGENLADLFTVSSYICYMRTNDPSVVLLNDYYIVYSYPEFEVISSFSSEQPAPDLSKLFLKNTASIPRCIIRLKEIPEEQYDEITLSFCIKLSGESLLKYSEIPVPQPFDETVTKVLQGDVTVHF